MAIIYMQMRNIPSLPILWVIIILLIMRILKNTISNASWAFNQAWQAIPKTISSFLLLTLLVSLTPVLSALFTRELINSLIEGINGITQTKISYFWFGLTISVISIEAVSQNIIIYLKKVLNNRFNIQINLNILSHATQLDIAYLDSPSFKDTIENLRNETSGYARTYIISTTLVITTIIQIVGLVIVLATVEPYFLLSIIPIIIPYGFYNFRLSRVEYKNHTGLSPKRRWNEYFWYLILDSDSAQEIKLYNIGNELIRKYEKFINDVTDTDLQIKKRILWGNIFFVLSMMAIIIFVVTRIINRVFTGDLTIGDIAIFLAATTRIRNAFSTLVQNATHVRQGLLQINDLRKFLDIQKEDTQISQNISLHPISLSSIKFKNVSFSYPESPNKKVLNNINLAINPGEAVAIVGKNGSGKSTLIKLLVGFYKPTSGKINIDTKNLHTDFNIKNWQAHISLVAQQFNKYEASVFENIAFGDWSALNQNRGAIKEISKSLSLHEIIEKLPNQYETILGTNFGETNISLGQWQKIAIARAFAREHAWLLILDEPTASLDAITEYEVFNQFKELAKKRTTILISHRFSTVSLADRIIVIDEGEIIEQGSHKGLIEENGFYAHMYNLHVKQFDM